MSLVSWVLLISSPGSFPLTFLGIDMCFEHPIKNDVLKMVQDEMSTLVTSVEDNKETWKQDHEGLRNNLQNLTQSLEAKHTSLRTGFERLESQQQILEEKVSRLSQGMDTGNDFLKTGKKADLHSCSNFKP